MAFTFSKNVKQGNNIYSSIYPLMLASTLFGLAPVGFKPTDGNRRIQFSKWSLAGTMVLLTIYVVTVICIMSLIDPPRNILCKIRFYEDIFSSVLYICEVIMGCVQARNIIKIIDGIEEVDIAMRHLNMWIINNKKIYVYVMMNIIFAFSVLSAVFMAFTKKPSFVFCYKPQVYSIPLVIFTYYIPYVGNLLMELQYFYLVNILRIRYKDLNLHLSRNCVNKIWSSDSSNPSLSIKSEPILVLPKIPEDVKGNDVHSITQLTSLHMKLSDTARLINHAFDLQQLVKITICFVSTVIALFLFAMVFTTNENQKVDVDWFFVVWALSNAAEIFAVVWISSETCKEANDTSIILQRIGSRTGDKDLSRLIDLHSLQMHHTKLTLTICGLFPLDYSLLFMIIAGVTTYLVILIQFNLDIVKSSGNETLLN